MEDKVFISGCEIELMPYMEGEAVADVISYRNPTDIGMVVKAHVIKAIYEDGHTKPKEVITGMNRMMNLGQPFRIKPFNRVVFGTGVRISVPEGYEVQVRNRSGLAIKAGLAVVNSPSSVDPAYPGEISVAIINLNAKDAHIYRGSSIAEVVIAPVRKSREVYELSEPHFRDRSERYTSRPERYHDARDNANYTSPERYDNTVGYDDDDEDGHEHWL